MIRNEVEYQNASARLKEEQVRLAEHRGRWRRQGCPRRKSSESLIPSNRFICN